jgi:hypothetical protein
MYPLQLVMFPVFIKLGSLVFSTDKLPLQGSALWSAAKHHPWDTTRLLWRWEWHALVVWVVVAAVGMPLIAMALKPGLEKMARKMHRKTVVAEV